MRILFIHQNFPAQFKHIAPEMARLGHKVYALCLSAKKARNWKGVNLIPYTLSVGGSKSIHHWAQDIEAKLIRADACLSACLELKKRGLKPDVIVAHPGWGESMFVKEIWPSAKLLAYCEYFYHTDGSDIDFDNEFQPQDKIRHNCKVRLKNLNNYMHFESIDSGISPTNWQASTFPSEFTKKIEVIHDGIDTRALSPRLYDSIFFSEPKSNIKFRKSDEIITFVNRTLEPYRGYHIFMRSIPYILREREKLHIFIVGGAQGGYGAKPENGETWKEIFYNEIKGSLTNSQKQRIHFVGNLDYQRYLNLLSISSAHVYLTYPFVLSWSLLEAMSLGIPIIASDTPPVQEIIRDEYNGSLFNFFDFKALAESVVNTLSNTEHRLKLSTNARHTIQEKYDLEKICLPRQVEWVYKSMQEVSKTNLVS